MPCGFDALPAAHRAAMVADYLVRSDGRGQEPCTAWESERFFRSLDAKHLKIWAEARDAVQ